MKTETFQCDPLPYELTEHEKQMIEKHRAEYQTAGEPCRIHLTMPLYRGRPDGPHHGCVACGFPIA